VPSDKCATLFDDEDCNGWSVDVSTGYTELSFRERNEAEAVVVRPGCKFVGYDRADKNIIANRGESIAIDATNSGAHVWMNLKGEDNLEEEISATACTCGPVALPFVADVSGPSRPRPFFPTDNVPRVPNKFGARITTEEPTTAASASTTTPTSISQCTSEANWSGKQCATLYQDQNCIGWRLDVDEGYTALTRIQRHNDAEVIVIRPGCKFVGYEYAHRNPKLRGRSVAFDAAISNKHTHDAHHHNGEGDGPHVVKKLRDSQLRNRIDSIDCSCKVH